MSNTANPQGEEKHPEYYCHNCHNINPVWSADNDLFNSVNDSPNGIICPSCFHRMAKSKGIEVFFKASSTPPTESEPDFGFAHWASAMGWVFDFADEMWYKEIGGDEKIGVSAIKTDQQLYSLYQTHLQESKNKEL